MKIAQIGLGGWGKNHTKHLHSIGELVAVCDIDPHKLDNAVKEYNCNGYKNMSDLLVDEEFDIAIITTPTNTHHTIAKHMIANNKHVFIEKPITETFEQGIKLVKQAEDAKVNLTCGYIERFNPVTQFIKQFQINPPKLIEFHRSSKLPVHMNGIGVVLDTLVHDIDTACYLYNGYPKEIVSKTTSLNNHKFEDISIATLVFENGIANLVANWNTNCKLRIVHSIYDNSIVRGDFVKKEIRIIQNDNITIPTMPLGDPLYDELKAFIDDCQNNTHPKVSGLHASMVTKIANQIIKNK